MSEVEANILSQRFRELLDQLKTMQSSGSGEEAIAMLLGVAAEMTESCAFDLARGETRRDVTELILIAARLDRMAATLSDRRTAC